MKFLVLVFLCAGCINLNIPGVPKGTTGTTGAGGCSDCNKKPPAPSGGGTLSGLVTDSKSGTRLAGVNVSIAGGGSTTTDSNGEFGFSNLPMGAVLVSFSLMGYAPGYAQTNISNQAASALVSLKPEGTRQAYDPTTAATISQKTQNGPYAVSFQPNTLDTTDTNLHVSVTPLDPTSEIDVLPGSLATTTTVLTALTFAEFSIYDSTGARVNLKSGSEAIVELPIPADLRNVPDYALGSTIHCYSYSPASGQWQDFVVGTVAMSSVDSVTPVVRASVKHFSWYGAAPEGQMCRDVYGTVVSKLTHSPLANAHVISHPGTDTYSDGNGSFHTVVPANGQWPTVTAYQTLIDVDGSLSGMPGAKVIEYGELPVQNTLIGLTLRSCSGPTPFSTGTMTDPYQLVVGQVGLVNYAAQGVFDNGTATVSVTELGPDGKSLGQATGAAVSIVDPNGKALSLTSPTGGVFLASSGLTTGARYQILVDADGNGSIDGKGSVVVVGTVALTMPAAGSSASATGLTVAWSDTGSAVSDYVATYFVSLTETSGADAASYTGTNRQFSPTSSKNAGMPLAPGHYQLSITAQSGANSQMSGTGTTNNISGPIVNGTVYSFSQAPAVQFDLTP